MPEDIAIAASLGRLRLWLALNPGGTAKKSMGATNVIVECGGKTVHPGDFIVGDRDGVVVIVAAKIQEVLERAEAIAAKEVQVKELLKQGKSTVEIYGMQ
jgi:4-hydroxy-4-methyl-2-oxoglutarate aldolase